MKLPFELFLVFSASLAAPLAPRAASFPQLAGLTSSTRDVSTTDARWPSKYFHESVYHPHYDGRFASAVQPRSARLLHMRLLLRSYMAAMNRAGVRTWIMHGSLLAWWWGGGVFPWDSDLDFCVDERGMEELGAWWNMTVHEFSADELGLGHVDTSGADSDSAHADSADRIIDTTASSSEANTPLQEPPGLKPGVWTDLLSKGKKYLLEVNPHAPDPSTADPHNKIDARWIDTSTGLFIDITTVHPVPSSTAAKSTEKHLIFLPQAPQVDAFSSSPEEMYTKDTHLYTTAALFPLRRSRLEGVDVWVPYAYEQLLLEEYGPRALVETGFNGWRFERGGESRSEGESKSESEKGSESGSGMGKWVVVPDPGVVEKEGKTKR